jgi:uncharacterized SAM-binding protein YcdF (DUF218 family)
VRERSVWRVSSPLSDYHEIAVVLGGGLRADGSPTPSTLRRADAAATLAKTREVGIIVSGSHGDGPRPARTEAEFMAERLFEQGTPRERVFLEDQSRDTLSNAAFVAERYLAGLTPRRVFIVTSPFHMARSLATFALVLGEDWPITAHPSAPGEREDAHAATEALYLDRTHARLRGITPGDIPAIAARARATLAQNVSDD